MKSLYLLVIKGIQIKTTMIYHFVRKKTLTIFLMLFLIAEIFIVTWYFNAFRESVKVSENSLRKVISRTLKLLISFDGRIIPFLVIYSKAIVQYRGKMLLALNMVEKNQKRIKCSVSGKQFIYCTSILYM